jgi:pyruvate formate lyase activating enzyme
MFRVWRRFPLKGRVFDIKRYSIHDGPGIRTTVFLKGCPLHCLWCHNPESIDGGFELMHWSSRCARCYACVKACPLEAIRKTPSGAILIDRGKCDLCGACAEACLYDALQVVGRAMTVEEVVREVEKDRLFYEQSGGGVTFSGGDPLSQPGFLEGLLDTFRSRGVHTAVDTAGASTNDVFDRVAAKTDLVLFDLKVMDADRHRELTGIPNALILDNLRRLAAGKTEVWIRIPLIAGVNDGEENIRKAIEFLRSLEKIRRIAILPYHSGGIEKAGRIGKRDRFEKFESPPEERIVQIEEEFRAAGFEVNRGG